MVRIIYFLTKAEFEERIRIGDLVEWEEIYGNYYGTLKVRSAGRFTKVT